MTDEPLSDEDLFRGVQERDARAWELFVDRFGPLVAAVPRRAGLGRDLVDDVVQATWVQLLTHARAIRRPRSLPSWVLTTAARETWRLGARERERPGVERMGLGEERQEVDAVDLVRLERIQMLRDAVARLSGRCRALLEALFLAPEPAPYDELARSLGMAVGSIGPTRQRCLAHLARDLSRAGFAEDDEALEARGGRPTP